MHYICMLFQALQKAYQRYGIRTVPMTAERPLAHDIAARTLNFAWGLRPEAAS